MSALSGKMVTDMKKQEIKLEQMESTIRKVLTAGGSFSFYPRGTSMQPFIVQGRDKVTLAALPDRIKKYDIILYKRENGTFVLHRVTGKKENAYIFRGDNQFSDEYGIKREQMIGRATEIIRGDEVIPVNDIKHRMWAGFWVNTVFFRRVKRFCLKCRKKKQNLDKNKSC